MRISPNDRRRYRSITLDNALSVLLISDPQAAVSASALSVKVGHFSDPLEREGLAHFLEHMLFLGTEKYPKTGEFQEFITQHGGSNNAWTGTENTTYFFDIQHEYFSEALDRFGQFFISPLFDFDAVDKERNAVDSEYRLKIDDDARRIYQVKKETINPCHPFAKFSVGNLQTLADREGRSIREELLSFYHRHYSANIMTAALISSSSLEVLTELAQAAFSGIVNSEMVADKPIMPFREQAQMMQWVKIEPIKDLRKLSLSFLLKKNTDDYKHKSESYIAHLLGDESVGSLMSLLKNKNWINSLSAGVGLSGSNYKEFILSIKLTPVGLKHIDDIVSYVFQMIALVKKEGLTKWRYDEMKKVHEAAFYFKEPAAPLNTVSQLVIDMQEFEPEDLLYGNFMMQGFEQEKVADILSQLKPQNMCLTLVAKGGKFSHKANWYFTPYEITLFSAKQLKQWQANKISANLALPKPNLFISDELVALPLENSQITHPQKLQDEKGCTLWFLQEAEFHLPKGIIYISIDSPESIRSVSNIVKTHLCVEMLLEAVNEQAYPAEIANLSYSLYSHQTGIGLMLSGFSQKLPLLLELITTTFLQRKFHQNRFTNIKMQLKRAWKNTLKEKPITRLYNKLVGFIQGNAPPYEALLDAIAPIERKDLVEFLPRFLSNIYIDIFVYGNWHKMQAIKIAKQVKQALYVDEQSYRRAEKPIWVLGQSGTIYAEKACQGQDSAIIVYYQSAKKGHENIALYRFAQHLMSAVFFNELRTRKQLGYMVGATYRAFNQHAGLVFYVQSPLVGPSKLLEAIDDFLNAFYLTILELDQEKWHSSKQGFITKLSKPETTLRSRGQRWWNDIATQCPSFDQKEKIIKAAMALSKEQMIDFAVQHLREKQANRLILYSCSSNHSDQSLSQHKNKID